MPSDHPDKGREIGSEATPADFLDTLLDVVEACDRVLAPHGSIVFELGDTYSGSGGAGGDYNDGGLRGGQPVFRAARHGRDNRIPDDRPDTCNEPQSGMVPVHAGNGWPLAKSLTGIPTLFAWSLAYGRNLLNPERTTPQWRIRNVIAWCRPNPPVGALGDKFRPATSYLTVATKSSTRYFDLDAVRFPPKDQSPRKTVVSYEVDGGHTKHVMGALDDEGNRLLSNPAGAPPLDWWEIPTAPYKGSHYATWPPNLLTRPIESMCPRRVCRMCGEPSRRIVDTTEPQGYVRKSSVLVAGGEGGDFQANGGIGRRAEMADRSVITIGWTDCGHDDFRNGVVLDPFAGSGTTLAVATGLNRDAIGIDIDERNLDLARQRVGMFLVES